ncbi:SAV_915 family protein [Saccharopolyspora dendranthemae]|uniref:SAV_915 family protein n=1 Tax=Saccharopolyspora dendranthemae TaxID=1181886 RepID=UPI0011A76F2C|nr:SAV_915 family protein [Saccharopolyspora dendranthemae]
MTRPEAVPAGKPIPPDFPPVVYLPCVEQVSDASQARIAMRETRDGRVALLAYSALDRLQHCCGTNQPWLVMPTVGLDELQRVRPFSLLLLDVFIPEENRQEAAS